MTYIRSKNTFRYKRWCKLHIVKNCDRTFSRKIQNIDWLDKHKRRIEINGKKCYGCQKCLNRLHELKLSIKRYKKMSEDLIEENIDWKNSEEGTYTRISTKGIKDPTSNELIGIEEVKHVQTTTKHELLQGLELIQESINKKKTKKALVEGKIKSMGKKPNLQKRHEQLIQDLQTINRFDLFMKQKKELDEVNTQLQVEEKLLSSREEMLEHIPK